MSSIAAMVLLPYNFLTVMASLSMTYKSAITSSDFATTILASSNLTSLYGATLILLAKLYSDYWQRKGLQMAFNKIAYSHVIKNLKPAHKFSRWYQICSDSYAKEIYGDNPKLSEKIFNKILKIDGNKQLLILHTL